MARFRIFFGNPPPAGAGELAGTIAGTSTATGVLIGLLALSGTAAGVGGQSGTLNGVGALAGTSAGVTTTAGTLTGSGALAGTAAGVSTATGDLEGKAAGTIDGTAAGTSTASGSLSVVAVEYSPDLRELILRRIQYGLLQIGPSGVLTFPGGYTTTPFLTDLGGRAYSRHRGVARLDRDECPYAEILPSRGRPDLLEPLDADSYACTMLFDVIGYDRADDQGDGLDADVRMRLHDLAADLRLAVEASVYATGTEPFDSDPLIARVGNSLRLTLLTQDVAVADDGPFGFVLLSYSARYVFGVRDP